MVDKTDITEVVSVYNDIDTNSYLKAGWVIIETSPGTSADGSAYALRLMGLPKKDH